MKTLIKKTFAVVILAMAVSFNANAGNDKPIKPEQLPTAAQQLLKKHFKGQKVALAKMETEITGKSYDVILTNSTKVEFDSKGKWTNIECAPAAVPTELIPAQIKNKVKELYGNEKITEIERDRRGYDVKLSNGIDVEFDKKFEVVDIDD